MQQTWHQAGQEGQERTQSQDASQDSADLRQQEGIRRLGVHWSAADFAGSLLARSHDPDVYPPSSKLAVARFLRMLAS